MIIKDSIKDLLETAIKTNDDEFKNQKIKEYKSILKLINVIENNKFDFKGFSNILSIPESSTDFSEYRVIDDTDTESRDLWIDSGIRLIEGDIVIELKK